MLGGLSACIARRLQTRRPGCHSGRNDASRGEGAAAARKAKASEAKQSLMATLYAPTAFTDLIPTTRFTGPILNRVIANSFLRHLLGHAIQDGTSQTAQQILQNAIKRKFLDPNQEVTKDIRSTFAAGTGASVAKELLVIGVKALLRLRGSWNPSASQPEAATQARQSLEEILQQHRPQSSGNGLATSSINLSPR